MYDIIFNVYMIKDDHVIILHLLAALYVVVFTLQGNFSYKIEINFIGETLSYL